MNREKPALSTLMKTTLSDWLKLPGNTQSSLAKKTNFSQPGVRKMRISERKIFVVETKAGVKLFEFKELSSQKKENKENINN